MEEINNPNVPSPREENLPIPLTGSPARATSEKALIQSDARTTLHRDDTEIVDRHANSTALSVTAESHTQTKELRVALAASSEQQSKAAKHIQVLMDVEETRDSLTKTS